MTKEHGLVGTCQRSGPVEDKNIYDMAKSFAVSVGKGEVEAKPENQEVKKASIDL